MPSCVRATAKFTTPRAFACWVSDLVPIDAGLGVIVRVTSWLGLAPESVMVNGTRAAGARALTETAKPAGVCAMAGVGARMTTAAGAGTRTAGRNTARTPQD